MVELFVARHRIGVAGAVVADGSLVNLANLGRAILLEEPKRGLADVGAIAQRALLAGFEQGMFERQLIEQLLRALDRRHLDAAGAGEHIADQFGINAAEHHAGVRERPNLRIVDVIENPGVQLAADHFRGERKEKVRRGLEALDALLAGQIMFHEAGREPQVQRIAAHLGRDGVRQFRVGHPHASQHGLRFGARELVKLELQRRAELGRSRNQQRRPAADDDAQRLAHAMQRRQHAHQADQALSAAILRFLERVEHQEKRRRGAAAPGTDRVHQARERFVERESAFL